MLSGSYERSVPIEGGFQSDEMHFYDFCLAQRASGAKGQLVDYFPKAQPLGEVLFVPAGSRYLGGSGAGKQVLFVKLDKHLDLDHHDFSMI